MSKPIEVAERVLKRKLNWDEVIYHIDGNRKNNKLNNLVVVKIKDHLHLISPEVKNDRYEINYILKLKGIFLINKK